MFDENSPDLTPKKIADTYLKRDWPSNDDPIDDILRVLSLSLKLAGLEKVDSELEPKGDYSALSIHRSLSKAIGETAERCSFNFPALSVAHWVEVIDLILAMRYGGTSIYIKRRDNLVTDSVRSMMPKQIMEKFGVSRSYAYRLLRKK